MLYDGFAHKVRAFIRIDQAKTLTFCLFLWKKGGCLRILSNIFMEKFGTSPLFTYFCKSYHTAGERHSPSVMYDCLATRRHHHCDMKNKLIKGLTIWH